ncbi:hypothetical protein FRC01_006119 [Tulasnella sp. 417]|nr:hypothetical protein FRC01_006119 [Tulasnella sp. 417]
MEEANIEQIPAAGARDVQEEALGPIIEGHQEGIQATIDEGVSPGAEGSGDTGAPSLPARPPQSAFGTREFLPRRDAYYCDKCNYGFPTFPELRQKHKLLVHALPPQSTSTEEVPSASPPPQPAAPALDTSDRNTQDEASGSSVPAEVANTSRPIDLLFASLLPPSQLTSSGNPSAPETAEPVESPTPVPSPSDLPEGVQPDTAPASIAPDLLPSIPPSTRATFSARPRRPFRNYSSPRFNPLYCNRCQVAFTTLQEQKEHLRKGISAIIPDENNEENLVCAQCKQSNRDIHAMKAHLQSHETTCIECLIYFHSPRGLQDHRELQHMASPNDEGTSANSWPRPQPSPIVHSPPEPRTTSPPSDQSSSLHSSQTLLPQENPQSSVNAANTFPSTVIQTPAPSLSDAPETVDAASSPSFASTALSSQPAHPARSDPLFCRKCKLDFANSQERKDHWRNGMSAIKPAQNDDDSLVARHDLHKLFALLSYRLGDTSSGDDLPVEQPQAQPSPIAHPPPEPRPVSPPPDPTERPAAPAPRECGKYHFKTFLIQTKMNHPISTIRSLEGGKTRKDSVVLMRMRTPFGRVGMYRDAIRDLEAGGGQRNRDGGGKANLNLLLGTHLRLVAYPETLIRSKLQHRPSRATFTQKYLESRQWPFHAVSA